MATDEWNDKNRAFHWSVSPEGYQCVVWPEVMFLVRVTNVVVRVVEEWTWSKTTKNLLNWHDSCVDCESVVASTVEIVVRSHQKVVISSAYFCITYSLGRISNSPKKNFCGTGVDKRNLDTCCAEWLVEVKSKRRLTEFRLN